MGFRHIEPWNLSSIGQRWNCLDFPARGFEVAQMQSSDNNPIIDSVKKESESLIITKVKGP